MMFIRRGVTLIEVVVGLLIGSLLLLSLSRIFSEGFRISQKGSSHLTNMQAASILMAQIEQDLSAALLVEFPGSPDGPALKIGVPEILDDPGRMATSTILYERLPDKLGFMRKIIPPAGSGAGGSEHIFCRGLITEVSFTPGGSSAAPAPTEGISVEISTRTPPAGTEENRVKRFVYCLNLPPNHARMTGDWRY